MNAIIQGLSVLFILISTILLSAVIGTVFNEIVFAGADLSGILESKVILVAAIEGIYFFAAAMIYSSEETENMLKALSN